MRRLEAAEINVGRLLAQEDYEFVIPEYQRPYAWGTDESLQLLSDLLGALDRDTDEPYFLGSIVLVKSPQGAHSEVIDGQQRLTTLTLLLALIRDVVHDEELREEIHSLIERKAKLWNNQPAKPRLKLRPRDNQFFFDFVQSSGSTKKLIQLSDNIPETDSQRGLRDNARALHEELEQMPQEQLKDLFVLIASRAFLVTVAAPDLNSAYRIFSVMNSRGMPLSPQDIFKSHVIGAIDEGERQRYADRWEELEEALGREEFKDLFLYIRAIKTRTRGVKSLLTEFPEKVLKPYMPNNGSGFIRNVLEPYAKSDIRLKSKDFHGDNPNWENVNNWIKRLDRLGNDDWRPVALWALTEHGEDPDYLVSFLSKLERLAASMLIRRQYATPRQLRYMDLLKQLSNGDGLDSASFELSSVEREETREQLAGDIYLSKKVRLYVLLRLDSILARDAGASYNQRIVTVEHVLPRNPAKDSQWTQDFTEEEAAHWTHKLGNLLLLNQRVNSSARNYDFDVKKKRYFTSKNGVSAFALTTQVLEQPVWTPDVVEQRQQELLDLLFKEWEL